MKRIKRRQMLQSRPCAKSCWPIRSLRNIGTNSRRRTRNEKATDYEDRSGGVPWQQLRSRLSVHLQGCAGPIRGNDLAQGDLAGGAGRDCSARRFFLRRLFADWRDRALLAGDGRGEGGCEEGRVGAWYLQRISDSARSRATAWGYAAEQVAAFYLQGLVGEG